MIKLIKFFFINICLFQLINCQIDSLFSQIKGQPIPLKGQLESLEDDFKGLSGDLKSQLKPSQLTKTSKLTGKLPITDGVKNLSTDKLANVNALKDLSQALKGSNLPTDKLNKIREQLPGGLPKKLNKKAAAPVLGDQDDNQNEDDDDQDDQAKSSTTTPASPTSPKITTQKPLTQSLSPQTAHPVQPQEDDEEQTTSQIIQTTSTEKIENSNNKSSDEDDEESNENRADRPVRRKGSEKTINQRRESIPVRQRQDKEMQRRNDNEDDEDYYDDD